jgi:hypothetical protein
MTEVLPTVADGHLERLIKLQRQLGRDPTVQERADDDLVTPKTIARRDERAVKFIDVVIRERWASVHWTQKPIPKHHVVEDDSSVSVVVLVGGSHPDVDLTYRDWATSETAREVDQACALAASEAARKQEQSDEAYRQFRASGGTEYWQFQEALLRIEHSAMADTFRKQEQKVNGVDDD